MAFHVGQKVVCVDDSFNATQSKLVSAWVKRGAIYTVRAIVSPDFTTPVAGVALEEIVGQIHPIFGEEYGWRAARFRPIVEKKTDIGFAHEILRKVTRKDRVRA